MTLNTYGHIIEDLRGQSSQPAEAIIRAAREKLAPARFDVAEAE